MNKKIFCMRTTIKTTLNKNDKYDIECRTKILPINGQSFEVQDTFEDQEFEQVPLQEIITESQQDALSILREYPNILGELVQDGEDIAVKSEHAAAELPSKGRRHGQIRSISYRIGLIPENINLF
jgi:hypothetical protein